MSIWVSIYYALEVKGCFPPFGFLMQLAYELNLWFLLK